MPELPDVELYLQALAPRVAGRPTERADRQPFVVRTFDPPIAGASRAARVANIRRLGKRIVFALDGELFLVLHLMIAGRLRWRERGAAIPGKVGLAAFDFPRRHAAPDRSRLAAAGLDPHRPRREALSTRTTAAASRCSSADLAAFAERLTRENHTLKRALTDPHIFSGIGNAYSDEILHAARLSPMKLTAALSEEEIETAVPRDARHADGLGRAAAGRSWRGLSRKGHRVPPGHGGARQVRQAVSGLRLAGPAHRLRAQRGELLRRCQTGGRLLSDRALSRLLERTGRKHSMSWSSAAGRQNAS